MKRALSGPDKSDRWCERCTRYPALGLACCSSHQKWLCEECYRVTHFVEVTRDSPGYFVGTRPGP